MAAMIAPISSTIAALLGAGVGVGLLLVCVGWHGRRGSTPRPRSRRSTTTPPHRARRVVIAVAVSVVTGAITGWVVGAVLAGLACWSLPGVLGPDRQHARRISRVEAIATWTEMLRDTLSAAAGLEQAVLATTHLAPSVIRGELAALSARIAAGARLAAALRQLADELADPTGDLVIAALVLAADRPARQLSDVLGSLAHAAREHAAMRMRVGAGRARTRTSVRVIVGTTLGFAVTVVLLNRDYLTAYDTATGQLVLLSIGALFAAGFTWLARIAHPGEPTRFLASDPAASGQG
ncbi:pilus assembly protein TadB [Allokutzneria sp. A3M-2-11 16]|uniref:type II secretion system F family protein n=1 Tax=Allokutzneria sp. A3M-2-11 16 TaxID=2962043 RepID=UPI0020B7CED2|nr:pilus assembly protein TadB [Allokutzneria sp. A3M-2-11 16]MCP3800700.1 pilus assembly protein TadB [Allokutzneria sp. A3M-2-11 16]